MRKALLIAALGLAVMAPGAWAGIGWELKAADEVQRVMTQRHPSYDFVANCRSLSATRFTCEYVGSNTDSSCYIQGRATVQKLNRYRYRARILSSNKSCL
jgi:hypothetical protein